MKLTVRLKKEIEAVYLKADVAVRYDDEDIPFDAPLRVENRWVATINLEEGRILDWPQGQTLEINTMKICDEGVYTLLDADMKEIKQIDGYVPGGILPEGGDYLTLIISETGHITNWPSSPSLEDFELDEDD